MEVSPFQEGPFGQYCLMSEICIYLTDMELIMPKSLTLKPLIIQRMDQAPIGYGMDPHGFS